MTMFGITERERKLVESLLVRLRLVEDLEFVRQLRDMKRVEEKFEIEAIMVRSTSLGSASVFYHSPMAHY